jgi:hypothetical protein
MPLVVLPALAKLLNMFLVLVWQRNVWRIPKKQRKRDKEVAEAFGGGEIEVGRSWCLRCECIVRRRLVLEKETISEDLEY